MVLVTGLLLTVAACSHGGTGAPQPDDRPVRVEVTNNYALPMEIYAVGSGATHRLGTVHPGMVGSFVIPPGIIGTGSVELQAHPTAIGQLARSGQILLKPGEVVDFVITPQLFNSTATIRP